MGRCEEHEPLYQEPGITAETLTDAQIQMLRSTTTDRDIAKNCESALGIGSPIWSVRQAAREFIAELLNARGVR